MFGFKTGASAKEEKKPAPSGTNQPKAADPRMLGTGAAAAAGHKLKGRAAQIEAAIGYADGGKVTGPGTGTSDDIEAVVPEGSYIMPADSTEQIGEQNLAGMGSPAPVNLSNGEYQLPPEQVHAVGVKALDQMKNATHTPAVQQGAGFKPELFFADGGIIRKMLPASSEFIDDRTREFSSQIDAGNYAGAAGNALKTAVQGAGMYGVEAVDRTVSPWIDAAGRFVGGALGTDTPDGKVAPPSQAGSKPTDAPATSPAPAAKPVAPSSAPAAAAAPASPAATPAQPSAPLANNVTRVGNSFSGTNIGPGFTINGRPSGESFQSEQSEQNKAAVDALMARTPEFGAGSGALATAAGQAPAMGFNPGGPSVTVIGDSSQQDRARQRLISAASTAYRGAQNGQLTANQLRTMSDLIQSDDRNATSMATNSENNAVRMAEAAMREQGQNARTQLQEQGQNSRFEASNDLDQRRIAGEEEARGFSTRAAQRAERLYEQYDKAKPEDRAAIAQQIRELNGKEAPNRFTVVPGGQEIDPVTQQLVTRPAMVFNNQTGQFVPQQGGATGKQAPRPVGTRSTVNGKTAVWDGNQWIPQ